jgi:hypothetical protein
MCTTERERHECGALVVASLVPCRDALTSISTTSTAGLWPRVTASSPRGSGHPVKALAEQVRVAVIEAASQILGLDVAVVDVHVSDIHLAGV